MYYSVIVVEDDESLNEMFCSFLEDKGYKTKSFLSAEEALRNMDNVDIVVADINLCGNLDGLALTSKIKEQYEAEVIVITSDSHHSYAEAISVGASDFILKPVNLQELEIRVMKAIQQLELRRQNDQILERLERLATTDDLTGLYNSRQFQNKLSEEIVRSTRYQKYPSLVFLDIDNFKNYNDSYGHPAGDEVLRELGRVIKSGLRAIDSAYRYGGEEFTIILPETDPENALKVVKRLQSVIKALVFKPKGEDVSITVSIGVTQFMPNERITEFVNRADKAMYSSKNAGRDQITSI